MLSDPSNRPQIDVPRFGRAVGRRDRDTVLDDGESSQTKPWLRSADTEPDAARETVVSSVLDEQPGNAAERLIERGPTLCKLDLIPLDHRDRLRDGREQLVGAGDHHGLGERGDGENEIKHGGFAGCDGHAEWLAAEPR